ncbi:LysR family transcriptional regulator [Cohnella laeviribosi]|uniref:LysR family transcriptional regulator n=1 Tax=Cohnella laeviribosi TaxID=380174 RepID=UPI0003704ADF|nr:LysR family transcriptional regulator [Cohnella laeviribosi]
MDIRQMRYFIAIAEEGQITSAARRLNMAQPPLSQALKAMEEELGVMLFERGRHALTLTYEGEVFLRKAMEVVHHFEESIAEVKELGREVKGTLSVGATVYCSQLLLDKITAMREQNPMLSFRIREGYIDHLKDLMEKRKIEIAISHSPVDWPHVSTLPLDPEPFVLVLPGQWNLQLREPVDLADIADKPLILLLRPPHGRSIYQDTLREFQKRNLQPNIMCECNDSVMLLSLISAGFAMSMLPMSMLELYPSHHFRILRIKGNPLFSQPQAIWRKNGYLSKAAKQFLDCLSSE